MPRAIHFRGDERYPNGSPTLRKFVMEEEPDVQLIEGPIESGKTTGCIAKLYKQMCEMPRGVDGYRHSKFLITRPTYGELLETVVADWLFWFPEKVYGNMTRSEPYHYYMNFEDVRCEVVFMALVDSSEPVMRKLRSTQFTSAWVNEGQYCPLKLFTGIIDRCGRFPARVVTPNYDRRKRAILDNNAPPDNNHWIRRMRGDVALPEDMPDDQKMAYDKPENWKFYRQPAAVLERKDPNTGDLGVIDQETGKLEKYKLNPKAENLQHMGDKPYSTFAGKSRDEIDRDYRNISRPSRSGTPRHPHFDRDYHVAQEALQPNPDVELILGIDFGLTPAVMFEQRIDGRWYTYREHVAKNEGAEELVESIKEILVKHFPFYVNTGIRAWGDPQGGWRGSQSAKKTKTSFAILRAGGVPVVHPKPKDNPELRMSIGRKLLKGGINKGPKVIIDPSCTWLIAGLDGQAKMVTRTTPDGLVIKSELAKNEHSHPVEAWEYSKWGYGEGADMVKASANGKKSRRFNTGQTSGRESTDARTWKKVRVRA